ncbi:AIR synthase [Acidianus sulfidivorans JP7]|uniref:AIR synthase n=1 Tax=Acidianus sulfidivorans JP7 TaxID=619593 RepID=A0A2U9IKB7_9CREN|nr:AIR synthase related protein [Acidianus sulfidivorans]AWR96463.1 AIR synthase [Acidianus sulfidivorans JP7]
MSFGKIPAGEFLHKIKSGNCEICPSIGEDAGIVKTDNKYIVIHSDPITESSVDPGFLSVAVACNDINMKGVQCKWILNTILLSSKKSLDKIIEGINFACEQIGCSVIGGHTEVVKGLSQDIVVTTAFSTTDRVISAKNAIDGDYIAIVGSIGIEGTWILASEFSEILLKYGVNQEIIESAKKFKNDIIIQDKALLVSDLAVGMHDATEGGVYQAILEISKLSGLKAKVNPKLFPIRKETEIIAKKLKINPFTLVSSGSFIVITRYPEELLKRVKEAKIVGRLIKGEPELEVEGVGVYRDDFKEELVEFESNYYGGRQG